MTDSRQRLAVIGGGVAGITAAYLFSRKYDVTIFERGDTLGGHTNTREIADGPDAGTPVDTGFIVCNRPCYPRFYRFLSQLDVALRDAEMSFSFMSGDGCVAYRGPALKDLLATPANLLRPAFWRLFREQRRFGSRATADLDTGALGDRSLGQYLREGGYGPFFIKNYLIPLAASVWSCPDRDVLDFHAATFLTFWRNHGMLDLRTIPQWQTVVGGSRTYVRAFTKRFDGAIRLNAAVREVRRTPDGVRIAFDNDEAGPFDRVVLALHADDALAILADPSEEEARLLSPWRYNRSDTVLHTDERLLPANRRIWASWNYSRPVRPDAASPVAISYWMNCLQGLRSHANYVVTLNQTDAIDPDAIIYRTDYTHPIYTPAVVPAQEQLQALNGTRATSYCGSYLGYGFHEDAVRSACVAAEAEGITL